MNALSEISLHNIQHNINNNHQNLTQNKRKASNSILCRINFEIDGYNQEILIQQHETLQSITTLLIQKLNNSYCSHHLTSDLQINSHQEKQYLKEIIKNKLSDVLLANKQKSLQAVKWRNKLKEIIQEKNQNNRCSTSRLTDRNINQSKKDKKITYFGYNVYKRQQSGKWSHLLNEQNMNDQPNQKQFSAAMFGDKKEKTIYDRMKTLQRELNGHGQKQQNSRAQRLYDQAKQNICIKQFLSKMHNNQLLNQQLSECTFHPSLASNAKKQKLPHSDVFQRLYSQAMIKGEKMKQIQKKAALREQEDLKLYNFIPTINECSKKIVKIKKEHSQNVNDCFYDNSSFSQTKRQQNSYKQSYVQRCQYRYGQRQRSLKTQNHGNFQTKKQNQREPLSETFFNHEQINKSKSKTKQNNKPAVINDNLMKKIKINTEAPVKNKIIPSSTSNLSKFNTQQSKTSMAPPVMKINKQLYSNRSSKMNIQNREPIMMNKRNDQNIKKAVNNNKLKTQHYVIQESKTFQLLNSSAQRLKPLFSEEFKTLPDKREDFCLQNANEKKRKERLNPLQFFQQQEAMTTTKKAIQCLNQSKEVSHVKNIQKDSKKLSHKIQQQQQIINVSRINQAFSSIFNLLTDSSNTQQEITYLSIFNNQQIPPTVKKILYPMAAEMKELGVGLDRQEFIWSIGRIFETLSNAQKQNMWLWSLKLQNLQMADQI